MKNKINLNKIRSRIQEGLLQAALKNKKSLYLQFGILIIFFTLCFLMLQNIAYNLKAQGIASGFDFLDHASGFSIIQTLIEYSGTSTYGRVFLVGLLNTFLVSILGIIFASILGFTVGICRLSHQWFLNKGALVFIEAVRNIPLLLQIFIWYFVILRSLPSPRESLSLWDSIFLNNRGLYLPWFNFSDLTMDVPKLLGFNFQGGLVLIPELSSLLAALSIYTAAFIAEIVRAGILSVNRGQREAAMSLGLNNSQTLKLVIIPQAFRVIVPPLANQYLNLTKNSSLAAAIGYPDLVSVFAGTVLNQTGQAVEVIVITMGVYLVISLAIAGFMNWFNQKYALVGKI